METPPYLQRHEQVAQEAYEAALGLTAYLRCRQSNLALPKTANLMIATLFHTDSLYHSIKTAAKNRDMLACVTLTRAFIEQYVRFLYLFVRLMREPSDTLVVEYQDMLNIIEHFACKHANATARKDFGCALLRSNLWTEIQTEKPYFKKYSLSDAERLLEMFSWESISIYIEREKQTDERIGTSDFIYEHAFLVCSQHGGLTLNNALFFDAIEKENEEFERLCMNSLWFVTSIKGFICMLFSQSDKNFDVFYKRINQAVRDIWPTQKAT
jgi:hypothetical protein